MKTVQSELLSIVSRARELAAQQEKSHPGSQVQSLRLSRPAESVPAPPAPTGRARLVFVGKFEPAVLPLMEKIIAAMGLERGLVSLHDLGQGGTLWEEKLSGLVPAFIGTLGSQATQALLGTGQSFDQVRGKVSQWRGIPVLPSYGLSEMLYDETLKKPAWVDFQRLRDEFKALS